MKQWIRYELAKLRGLLPGLDAISTASGASLGSGLPSTIAVGDVAAIGSQSFIAFAGHKHGVPKGSPVAVGPGLSAQDGTSGLFADAEHRHAFSGSAGANATLTYITRDDETAELPNSIPAVEDVISWHDFLTNLADTTDDAHVTYKSTAALGSNIDADRDTDGGGAIGSINPQSGVGVGDTHKLYVYIGSYVQPNNTQFRFWQAQKMRRFAARARTSLAGGVVFLVGGIRTSTVLALREIVDGIYFENSSNSGMTSNWDAVTRQNNFTTRTNTGVLSTTSYRKFDIRQSGTSVAFYIDDALVATHTTNIPSGVSAMVNSWGCYTDNVASLARFLRVDYLLYHGKRT